ncbi:MAG: hypothetical protein GY765_42700 [bacterium]|nr:hypothetical protein [bacterium]
MSKNFNYKTFTCLATLCILLLFVSCGKDTKVRKYSEKVPAAEKAPEPHGHPKTMPAAKTATQHKKPHFKWQSPEGWAEDSKSSGFRLATFTVKSGDKEAVCTVIPLKGDAGGLDANARRWLGQIKANNPDAEKDMKTVMAAQEKFLTGEKFPATMLDFTAVTPGASDNSTLVTTIIVDGNSIFIKMTGAKNILLENRDKFKNLCLSFSPIPGA